MKKLFLIAFTALLSASCCAQVKDTARKLPIDSVALFSYHDVYRFIMQSVKDMPTQYGLKVLDDWTYNFQQLVAAYKQKQTSGKPK